MIGLVLALSLGLPQLDVPQLPPITRDPQVTFLDRNGVVIGVRGGRYGAPVDVAKLPKYVPAAFVSIEDKRFYEHQGYDLQGIARALVTDLGEGRAAQGASTITQQLARNLFLSSDRTLERKGQELIYAVELEQTYSKDQILGLYLSRVYFGSGAYGIEAAAERYFGVSPEHLTVREAAMLAAIMKSPTEYDPATNPDASADRTKLVLDAMVESGAITEAQRAKALESSPKVFKSAPDAASQYFVDWVNKQFQAMGPPKNVDLIVETTLDSRDEASADAAAKATIDRFARNNVEQAALVSLDPQGRVRAMIGGADYNHSGFNRAVDAHRQAGSSWKPFVYLTALEKGMTPDTPVVDQPVTIDGWSPSDFEPGNLGPITLQQALAQSINTVAASVADQVGRPNVAATARRLGIATTINTDPAMALGTSLVTPLEMAGAYDSFSNGGNRVQPFGIERIRTGLSHRVIWQHPAPATPNVIANPALSELNLMLRGVIASGTGVRAAIPGYDLAGKTGTTSDYRDAWFCGFTGGITTVVWVGRDDNEPMRGVTGGLAPAEFWKSYMRVALKRTAVTTIPAGPPAPLPPLIPTAAPFGQPPVASPTGQPTNSRRAAGAAGATPQQRPDRSDPRSPPSMLGRGWGRTGLYRRARGADGGKITEGATQRRGPPPRRLARRTLLRPRGGFLSRRPRRQRFPQFALQELAVGVPRQRVGEEPDVGGDLVAGEVAGAVGAQVLGRQLAALAQHHGGGHVLAQPHVRHAEHAALGDRRMVVHGGLDLGAIDVLATAQHHVLLAVDDEDEAVGVDLGDVAGVEPAVGDRFRGGLGAVQVALDHRGAAHPELADLALRDLVAVVVDALGLEGRHRRADAGRLVDEEVAAHRGDDPAGLGHAVAGVGPRGGDLGVDLGDQVRLQRRAAAAQAHQAGGVARGEVRVQQHLAAHHRHARHRGDALALDQLQRLAGVPLVHQHEHAARGGDRIGAAVVGGDVEERRGQQRDRDGRGVGRRGAAGLLARQRLHLGGEAEVHQVVDAAAVGELRALRPAGGARGVEDAGVGVGIDVHGGHRRFLGDDVRPGRDALRQALGAHGDQPGARGARGPLQDARQPLVVAEHHLRLGVVQRVLDLVGHPPGVHADHRDADRDRGPVGQHPLRIVAHGDGDAVARLHPLRAAARRRWRR